MEGNVPEGLGSASLSSIVEHLASEPTWNCVRLTYAVELFEKKDLTLRQSFTSGNNNASADLSPLLPNITHYNPSLVDMHLTGVFEAVVEELERAGIFVLMSNHVSKASWCCSDDDGNGWFDDEYFNTLDWENSLTSMSKLMSAHPNVVALDLRNELRSKKARDDQITEWFKFMPQGVDAVLAGDPSKLVFVSGLSYDNDLTFLDSDLASDAWTSQLEKLASNLVFEGHIYSWSPFGEYSGDCSKLTYKEKLGWPWNNDRPMVISETGTNVDSYETDDHSWYEDCVAGLISDTKSGYGHWLLGGSYYIRDGTLNAHDSFGLLNSDWGAFKNDAIIEADKLMDWT